MTRVNIFFPIAEVTIKTYQFDKKKFRKNFDEDIFLTDSYLNFIS